VIAVAAGGKQAAEPAGPKATGLFATDPEPSLVEAFAAAGYSGSKYAEAAVAWAPTEDAAVQAADDPLGGHRLEGDG
jgi:hypothetical protein